ncbi:MAG: M50 family metallopeptidase [Acidobacteriota bacterium]
MFGKTIDLFSIFGFKIRLDFSWFIVAILITWSLAVGYFPRAYGDLTTGTYWVMGALGALGLFASVIAHELSHATVARRFGVEMRGITLFIFGGVAEMTDEPPSPKAEFWVAVAGPIMSFAVGALFFLVAQPALPTAAAAVVGYLAIINVILAVFNLIPAFPLDGGRILRSILWQWRDDLRWATRITSTIGAGFGFALIGLGVLQLLVGGMQAFVGAMWLALIGLFLRGAAQMSYQQLMLRRVLEGEPVSRFMKTDPVTVPRSASVAEVVENFVYRHHFKFYPVVDDGRLLGCITTNRIKEVPREEWERTSAGAVAQACTEENSVAAGADAMDALSRMSRTRASRLMVVEDGRLVGILALKDLLEFFSLKIELEEGSRARHETA